jgi:hypothetical protein
LAEPTKQLTPFHPGLFPFIHFSPFFAAAAATASTLLTAPTPTPPRLLNYIYRTAFSGSEEEEKERKKDGKGSDKGIENE